MRGIHDSVRDYYSHTIAKSGPTALGVDWPSTASQYLRFVQLVKLCDFSRRFSLNDFGCGYGALLAYLASWHPQAIVEYHGIDISPRMIAAAQSLWAANADADFMLGDACRQAADYSLASGVFNVRLGHPIEAWDAYVASIITDLRDNSRCGFAVNFMLPWDDGHTEDALYRTRPERWAGFCSGELGCRTEILSGYGLREFTLLCRL